MIDSVSISCVATFGAEAQSFSGLSTFNYIFGPNGAGKTTISRVIADEVAHPACTVLWKSGTRLDVLAYNRDFVAKNFTQETWLKGIFTLGEEHVETVKKVEELKKALGGIGQQIQGFKVT